MRFAQMHRARTNDKASHAVQHAVRSSPLSDKMERDRWRNGTKETINPVSHMPYKPSLRAQVYRT